MKPLHLQICSTACIILYIVVDIAVGNWINVAILIPILCLSLFQLWWMLSGKKRQLRKRGLEAIEMLKLPYPNIENVITVQLAIANGCLSPKETLEAVTTMVRANAIMAEIEDAVILGTGNKDCRFNARSPHLLCAVNPLGSCVDCPHFEPKNK